MVISGTGSLTGTGQVNVLHTGNTTGDLAAQYQLTTRTTNNLTANFAGTANQCVDNLTYGSLTIANGANRANTTAAVLP